MFPKIGVGPQNGWFIMEILIKTDDLGVPFLLETPISQSWTLCLYSGWDLGICWESIFWQPVLPKTCHPWPYNSIVHHVIKNDHNKKGNGLVLISFRQFLSVFLLHSWLHLVGILVHPFCCVPGQISTTKILGPKLVKTASSVRKLETNFRDERPWWSVHRLESKGGYLWWTDSSL